MLIPFLLFGTPLFYGALIFPFLLLILFVESNRAYSALITIILTAMAFVAFGDKGIIPWVQHNPLRVMEYAGIYVLVGIVWGFVKWFFYVLAARDKYTLFRKRWIELNGEIDDAPYTIKKTNNYGEIAEISSPSSRRTVFQKEIKAMSLAPPKAEYNKGRIIFWMTYWPASVIWWFAHYPITRLWRFIYARLGDAFEIMSKAIFSKYADDFK